MPTALRSAASTSGLNTISLKFGEPISSSPSHTSTRLIGSFRPAALNACSAARQAICGPLVFVAPRPIITLPTPGRSTMRPSSGGELHSFGVVLLDVVHEVQRQRRRGAGVERGEDAWLARRLNHVHASEPRVARELRHVLGALRIVQILGGDRRQRDPLAQHLHRRLVLPRDLRDHRITIRLRRLRCLREQPLGSPERHRARGSGCSGHARAQKVPASDWKWCERIHGVPAKRLRERLRQFAKL